MRLGKNTSGFVSVRAQRVRANRSGSSEALLRTAVCFANFFIIIANRLQKRNMHMHILIVHFRLCRIPELSSLYGVGLFALCTAGTPAVFAAEIREKRSFRKKKRSFSKKKRSQWEKLFYKHRISKTKETIFFFYSFIISF